MPIWELFWITIFLNGIVEFIDINKGNFGFIFYNDVCG